MAKYRQVQETFWEDTKVLEEMTPEDRYFYLYLLTNPHTTQSGCYEISIKQMANETGYHVETIEKLLENFENNLKVIKYSKDTKELLIINWSKYNWTSSPKVLKCVIKEVNLIKNKSFFEFIKKLLIGYGYTIDTHTQQEQEKEQEKEQEQKDTVSIPQNEIYSYVEKNFKRILSATDIQILNEWINFYDCEILKYAVDISCKQEIYTVKYFEGILKNWKSQNLNSLESIIEFQKKSKSKFSKKKSNLEILRDLRNSGGDNYD